MGQGTLRERREQARENPGPLRRAREDGRIYWVRPWIWSFAFAVFAWATRGVSLLTRDEGEGVIYTSPSLMTATCLLALMLAAGLLAWKRLAEPFERWASSVAITVAAGWLCCVWWAVAAYDYLWYAWFFITLAGAVVYYTNHRQLEREDIAAEMRAWPGLVENSIWDATHMIKPRETYPWGYKLFLRRDPRSQVTNKDLISARGRDLIESRLGAPDNSADVEQDGRSKTDVVVTVVENDPHAEGVKWDGRVARSITDRMVIGKYADGALEDTRWWKKGEGGHHKLIAGITRSGKSTLMKLLACMYGPAEDTILWFIDLKGGMSFRRLFPLGDWSARKADEAMAMLRTANQLIEERAVLAGDWGQDPWEPSPRQPVYILFIDELAKMIGINAPRAIASEALPLLINIVQQGAGVGVLLCMATQFPTLEALGSSQLREQIEWAACFRLRDSNTSHFVLPNGGTAVDPAKIPVARRGTCYVDAGGELRESTLRCADVTKTQVDAIVTEWWDRTPEVPDYDLLVYAPDYRHRTIYTPDGEVHVTDPDTDPAAVQATEAEPDDDSDLDVDDDEMTEEQDMTVSMSDLLEAERSTMTPEQLVQEEAARAAARPSDGDTPEAEAAALAWKALIDAGDAGCAPKDIRSAADRGESWSFSYMKALRTLGYVEQLGFGRYRRHPDMKWNTPDYDRVRSLQQGRG